MKKLTEEEYRNWEFDNSLVAYLRERYIKKQRPSVVGQYYPSSLWRCIRQIILEWDTGMIPSDDTLKHFFAGEIYQDHIIDPVMEWEWGRDLTRLEQRVCIAIPYNKDKDGDLIYIRGRIDELTFLYIDGVISAVPNEAKTQKGGLKYRNTPNPDHVYQLMAYLAAVGAPYGKLIYMDRSTLKSRTFHVDFDERLLKDIHNRARYIHFWVTQIGEKVPPPEAMQDAKKKWRCRKDYCAVRDTCFRLEGLINDEADN